MPGNSAAAARHMALVPGTALWGGPMETMCTGRLDSFAPSVIPSNSVVGFCEVITATVGASSGLLQVHSHGGPAAQLLEHRHIATGDVDRFGRLAHQEQDRSATAGGIGVDELDQCSPAAEDGVFEHAVDSCLTPGDSFLQSSE